MSSMTKHDDRTHYPQPAPQVKESVNVQQAMQIALAVVALAGLPISGWMYLSDYIDSRIDDALGNQRQILQSSIERQSKDVATTAKQLDDLRRFTFSLCYGVRAIEPTFSCLSAVDIETFTSR